MAVESRLDSRYRFRLDRNRAPLSELGSPSTGAGPRPPISGHRSPAFGLRDPVTAIRNSELRVPTTELGLQNPNRDASDSIPTWRCLARHRGWSGCPRDLRSKCPSGRRPRFARTSVKLRVALRDEDPFFA